MRKQPVAFSGSADQHLLGLLRKIEMELFSQILTFKMKLVRMYKTIILYNLTRTHSLIVNGLLKLILCHYLFQSSIHSDILDYIPHSQLQFVKMYLF